MNKPGLKEVMYEGINHRLGGNPSDPEGRPTIVECRTQRALVAEPLSTGNRSHFDHAASTRPLRSPSDSSMCSEKHQHRTALPLSFLALTNSAAGASSTPCCMRLSA